MSTDRGIGLASALGDALADPAIAVLSVLTQLGDVWFVIAALTAVYWFHDRRQGLFAIGVAVGGLALVVALKTAFALPRPPPSVRAVPADGFGFPSGHAIAATVLWSLLAVVVDVSTRRRRAVVAAIAVLVVGATRVGLGVHYLVDVLTGIGIGLVYVGIAVRLGRGRPGYAFGAAAGLAAVAAVVADGSGEAIALLGAALGATAAWRLVAVPIRPWGRGDLVPATVGGVILGGVVAVGYALGTNPLIGGLAGAIGTAGIVAFPSVVAAIRSQNVSR